jgi:hypothetical protein
MRRLMFGGGLGVFLLSVVLVACGGSTTDSSDNQARRFQDMWEIDKIEKDFHGAMTAQDIDGMMSLFAPNATMTVGPGVTASGVDEIRRVWVEEAAMFQLQIVISPDCAKTGPEPRASISVAHASLVRMKSSHFVCSQRERG